jgi:phage baseplate assembly protein W
MALVSGWLFAGLERSRDGETAVLGPGLTLKPAGGIAMVEGEQAVRQAIVMLMSTMPGERVMRPDYGCPLNRLVFEPNDATTAGLAIHYVRQALLRWEPRVEIMRLDASSVDPTGTPAPGADAGNLLYIRLDYRVRATRRLDQLAMAVDLTGGVG